MYEWNIAYNFIMRIKKDFVDAFGERNEYSLKEMISALNRDEYNHFRNCVRITEDGSLALIKYSLVGKETPDLGKAGSMYREMRSLVIDMKDEAIVLCPFRKFFNIGELDECSMERVADAIRHAKTVEIANKLDGSMQQARYYKGKVVYTGSSAMNPEESWQLADGLTVFRADTNYEKMVKDNPTCTFIFEYTSPKNLIVVKYNEERLSLIGVRDVETGRQCSYSEMVGYAEKYGLPHTDVERRTFDEVVASAGDYGAEEKEGWVLFVDGAMYKMKCNQYREVHRILSFVSAPNVLMRSIADDYFDDVLSKVPEAYKENLRRASAVVYGYINKTQTEIDEWYDKMPKQDRKSFAMAVNKDVPKELRRFMFAKLNGQGYNVLKKHENTPSPHYMKLSEVIGTTDYATFFMSLGLKNVDAE